MSTIHLPEISAPFVPTGEWEREGGGVTGTSGARTDHFLPPTGEQGRVSSATLLTPAPEGDFVFTARVEADFAAAFDAGTLFVYIDEARWAKLCFEATPEVAPSVVSVVTRGRSDDANAFYPEGHTIYLRISRIGQAYAFHGSVDGAQWGFVRFFHIKNEGETPHIGFSSQSPTGEGFAARFTEVTLESRTLADLRDGS